MSFRKVQFNSCRLRNRSQSKENKTKTKMNASTEQNANGTKSKASWLFWVLRNEFAANLAIYACVHKNKMQTELKTVIKFHVERKIMRIFNYLMWN